MSHVSGGRDQTCNSRFCLPPEKPPSRKASGEGLLEKMALEAELEMGNLERTEHHNARLGCRVLIPREAECVWLMPAQSRAQGLKRRWLQSPRPKPSAPGILSERHGLGPPPGSNGRLPSAMAAPEPPPHSLLPEAGKLLGRCLHP